MGGKRLCHNITGIMQNMSVVPGGRLGPFFPNTSASVSYTEGDMAELFLSKNKELPGFYRKKKKLQF